MYLFSYFGCTYHASLIRGRRNGVSLLDIIDIIVNRFNLFAATAGAGACAGANAFSDFSNFLPAKVAVAAAHFIIKAYQCCTDSARSPQFQVHVQVQVLSQLISL